MNAKLNLMLGLQITWIYKLHASKNLAFTLRIPLTTCFEDLTFKYKPDDHTFTLALQTLKIALVHV